MLAIWFMTDRHADRHPAGCNSIVPMCILVARLKLVQCRLQIYIEQD